MPRASASSDGEVPQVVGNNVYSHNAEQIVGNFTPQSQSAGLGSSQLAFSNFQQPCIVGPGYSLFLSSQCRRFWRGSL